MNKKDTKIPAYEQHLFPKIKSYSVDEILAAGGATAFAEKMGKSAKGLFDALKELPKDAFLTDEEFEEAMKTLNASK
jgi:hypothetical protein